MRELIFTSSILILAVALLRPALGRHIPARARYALWLVVLLRLAIPFSPIESSASAAGLLGSAGPAPAAPAAAGPAAAADAATAAVRESGTPRESAVPNAPDTPKLPAGALYFVWAAGSLAAGGWMLAQNLRFARRLRAGRAAVELPDGWDGPGTSACPLPVWRCPGLASPCLFGVLRPAVYLNDAACQSPQALAWAVRHERQHYRHKDHVWCLARCICLAVYWWHPLIWLAAALSRRDCELACDEGVTAALAEPERLAYGRCLLALAPVRGAARPCPLAATGMSESARQLKARLAAIGTAHKTAVWAAALAVIAAAVLAVTTLTRAPALPRDAQAALEQLQNSVAVRDGSLGFTLPETGFEPGEWNIHISGSAWMGEGQMSLHFLEEQQQQGWQGGVWYSITDEASLYNGMTELWLDASLPDGDGQQSLTVNLLEAADDASSRQAAALAAALPEGEEVWVDYRLDEAYTLVYSYITAKGLPNNEDAVQGHIYLVRMGESGVQRLDPLVEEGGQLLDELAEGEGYFYWPPVWLNEGQRVLFGWQQTAGTALSTRLWTIENGAPKELDCPAEQLVWLDGGEFTGTRSAWDAIEDGDGGTGHTQKIYWLFWDEEAGALREYAGEEITEGELLELAQKGSSGENSRLVRQVLDAIRAEGGVLGSIWLRGNGVINLNYRIPLDGAGTAWANHNASFAGDANRNLSLIGFKDASPGGLQSELLAVCDQGGVYEAAGWPEIAADGRTVIGLGAAGSAAG